jgi:hypothetical protein
MMDRVANKHTAELMCFAAHALMPVAKSSHAPSPFVDRLFREASDMRIRAKSMRREPPRS